MPLAARGTAPISTALLMPDREISARYRYQPLPPRMHGTCTSIGLIRLPVPRLVPLWQAALSRALPDDGERLQKPKRSGVRATPKFQLTCDCDRAVKAHAGAGRGKSLEPRNKMISRQEARIIRRFGHNGENHARNASSGTSLKNSADKIPACATMRQQQRQRQRRIVLSAFLSVGFFFSEGMHF
jgi:hypothetical protein